MSKLLKAINFWSFPGGFNDLGAVDAIHLAKQHGYDALELCIGFTGSLTVDADESYCASLRHEADKAGVKLATVASGVYWQRSLADPDPAVREAAFEDLSKMLHITGWLGARVLLTIPGAVDVFFMPERPVHDVGEVYRLATEGIRRALPIAEQCRVRMGIENVWNRVLVSPVEMRDFIDQFDSPWVGAYVDVGNILPFGYAEQMLRLLGSRVAAIHLKDYRRSAGGEAGFVDLLEGDVNWPEVMKAIQEIGYTGPLTAEMIPHYAHHPIVRVINTSTAMDYIMGRK